MLGERHEIPKEDQLRLLRLGDIYLPNREVDKLASHAIATDIARGKMTKIGACVDYLRAAMLEAITKTGAKLR